MAELLVTPRAEKHLREASAWYDERAPGLGPRFLTNVAAQFSLLAMQPDAGRIYKGDCRRRKVRRFPYGVFYRVENEAVIIVAVLHLRRDPGETARLLTDRP